METFNIFPFMQYIFLDVKHSVGAGINTLMSIFEGTGPSVLFRKMEKARPMREKMDGKVVYFPPGPAFWLWYCIL